MSAYVPPDENLPIFNNSNYNYYNSSSLDITTADARYLKLAGGTEIGVVSFVGGLVTPTISNSTFVGTLPSSSASSGQFLTSGSTGATITGNNTYSGVNTYTNVSKFTNSGNQSQLLANIYVNPATTSNIGSSNLYFTVLDIPSVSGALTTTTAATLQVDGAPLAIGGGSITNSYSIYVPSGVCNFAGGLKTPTINNGANITVPSGSGTLALTSDLTGYVDTTSTQTITGLKSFQNNSGIIVKDLTTPASLLTLKASAAGSFNSSIIGQASANAIDFYLPATVTLNSGTSDFITSTSNTCSFINKSFLTNVSGGGSSCSFVSYNDASIGLAIDLSGASTASVLTLAGVQSANRTLTFPDQTGTLITKTSSDTLTNKILSTGSSWFGDTSDTTKTLKIDTSASTTGHSMTFACTSTGTRTWTFSDTSDTVTGNSLSTSLANKRMLNNSCTFADGTDNTKRIGFSTSGCATSTTSILSFSCSTAKTYTFPDITSTVAMLGSIQTFSALNTYSGGIASSGSTSIDFSGNSGVFKSTTGAVTIGSGAIALTGAVTCSSTFKLPTTGGTPTDLNYYEEYSATLKSNWSSTNFTINIIRVGSIITIHNPQLNYGSASTQASTLQFQTLGGSTTVIPTRLCPGNDVYFMVPCYYITGTIAVVLQITNAGAISVGLVSGNPLANFVASQDFNLWGNSVSYSFV